MSVDHALGSRRGWLWLVALLAGLGVLETIGALLIARALLPLTAAVAVDAIVVSWTVVALWIFASPLWGRVEIDSNGLRVRSVWSGASGCRSKPFLGRSPTRLGQGLRCSLVLASSMSPGTSHWSGQRLRTACWCGFVFL